MSNYELNSHKKSDKIKWIIAFTLIAVLLLGMVAMIVANLKDNEETPKDDTVITEQVADNDFNMQTQSTGKIRLMSYGVATVAADASVSKTLTATVLSATAENKLVDWSVSWGDSSNTATVTDYVTVTPSSNGSTTATVTCKKAFTGQIIVTVTTRESGYTADCIVTFLGVPTEITATGSISPTSGEYRVGAGQSFTFNVGLSNPFNSVSSQYNDITCSVSGVGSVVLGTYQISSGGSGYWYDSSNTTVTLDSLKDNFITISYANNVLTINAIKTIESYYGDLDRIDGGRTQYYTNKFREFASDCYFNVTIKENNSGITKVLKVRFDDSVVTGVNVSNAELSF